MKLRAAACLLLAVGFVACRREEPLTGLPGLVKSCQSEPTEACFQVGDQKPLVLLPEEGRLSAAVDAGGVFVRFWQGRSSYDLHFAPQPSGQIVPGVYREASVFGDRNQTPTLDVSLPHVGCSGSGSFILYDVAFDDTGTKVERLDVAFEMAHCGQDGNTPLRGRVRLNAATRGGLKGQLARLFGPREPELPPEDPAEATLNLETVADLCAIDADSFLCAQGNAGAWTAAGRRQVFAPRKDVSRWGHTLVDGVESSASKAQPAGSEGVYAILRPRHGTLFLPGLYEIAVEESDGLGPHLNVGNCNLARRGPDRFYVYEADLGSGEKPRHFLADFEARCGADIVVGRLALGSKLMAKASAESAGNPAKLRAALARILGESRKRTATAPRPVISLETVDSFCPDRKGTFLCFRSTMGEVMGQGRSVDAGPPLSVNVLNQKEVTVSLPADEALVQIAPPTGEELRSGAYYEGTRCDGMALGSEKPYLSLVLRNTDRQSFCRFDFQGRFQVLTLDRREDGTLENFAIVFELKTLDGAPVAGRLRVTGVNENNARAAQMVKAAREAKIAELRAAAPSAPPSPPTPSPPPVAEADARCTADGRTFERREGVWMESGTERLQPKAVITRESDPKFDVTALKARLWTALNLGPKVRAYVNGDVTEIVQHDPKDPFAGASCEVFGKVRLPRRLTEMGSALDAQLRQDGKRGLHVGARFVVDRDGKVSELLAADGLPDEYRALLLQDLQKMTYQPATLDGRPVAVVQSGTLTY